MILSLPAWGVWIEIYTENRHAGKTAESLPAWGVWIEIRTTSKQRKGLPGRSPHGECGLKYAKAITVQHIQLVAPRMGSVD